MSEVSREEFERLYKQINGNGQPGFVQKMDEHMEFVRNFITTSEVRQLESEDRQKKKEAWRDRWFPIFKWVGTGLAAVLLSLCSWTYQKVSPVLIKDFGALSKLADNAEDIITLTHDWKRYAAQPDTQPFKIVPQDTQPKKKPSFFAPKSRKSEFNVEQPLQTADTPDLTTRR
jgi:hypothetical protein